MPAVRYNFDVNFLIAYFSATRVGKCLKKIIHQTEKNWFNRIYV